MNINMRHVPKHPKMNTLNPTNSLNDPKGTKCTITHESVQNLPIVKKMT